MIFYEAIRKKHVACGMCELPFQSYIYLCKSGHSFCTKCMINAKICNLCQEPILYRNIAAEEFVSMLSLIQPELKDESEQRLENTGETKNTNVGLKCPFCCRRLNLATTNLRSHVEIEHRIDAINSGRVIKCSFSGKSEKKAYEVKNLKIFLMMYNTTNVNTRLKFINYSENESIRINGEIGRTKLEMDLSPNKSKIFSVDKGKLECCFTVDEINQKNNVV